MRLSPRMRALPRDAGWPDDLQAERRRALREAVDVRRLRRRRRDLAALGGLPEGAGELLEPGGLGHEQEARHLRSATLLASGASNSAIAATLVLSPHTVQDHIKRLFEKLGVALRQDLVARVLLDEYLPEVVQRTPLASRGRFDRD